ncbi:tetratricopeptide repeat protein [Halochromatium sp.]
MTMLNTLRLTTTLSVGLLAAALSANEPSTSVDALISRGEAQLAAQDIDTAIATLTQAVDAAPDSSLARNRLGGALMLGQRYGEAIDQFQRVIGRDPENGAAFIGLGMAYMHSGQPGPAKAALIEAKRLKPNRAEDLDRLIRRIDQGTAK